jgi:hypothetical protein
LFSLIVYGTHSISTQIPWGLSKRIDRLSKSAWFIGLVTHCTRTPREEVALWPMASQVLKSGEKTRRRSTIPPRRQPFVVTLEIVKFFRYKTGRFLFPFPNVCSVTAGTSIRHRLGGCRGLCHPGDNPVPFVRRTFHIRTTYSRPMLPCMAGMTCRISPRCALFYDRQST